MSPSPCGWKKSVNLTRKVLDQKRLLRENRQLKAKLEPLEGWGEMIGVSPGMKEVFHLIRKVAPLDCNVIIQGESGTGKELVARRIHRESARQDKPFVAFNCGGFTEELIASELFGYERGAFTGAIATKIGILETANRGTVFMDEIGDMPLSMQGKLLRVIQEKTITRVGGNRPLRLDLRFIAATNKDLKQAVAEGRFREDLYFRLNVVPIALPDLMERPEDIPLLIKYFLDRSARGSPRRSAGLDRAAQEVLRAYAYPGNVRELQNIIERAVALAEADTLPWRTCRRTCRNTPSSPTAGGLPWRRRRRATSTRSCRHQHQLAESARILALPRTTLWRKMKKYGLSKTWSVEALAGKAPRNRLLAIGQTCHSGAKFGLVVLAAPFLHGHRPDAGQKLSTPDTLHHFRAVVKAAGHVGKGWSTQRAQERWGCAAYGAGPFPPVGPSVWGFHVKPD